MATRAPATSMAAGGAALLPRDGKGMRRPGLRRQLPVASPISTSALVRAAGGRGRGTAHSRLSDLLREEYEAKSVRLCSSGTHALQLAITTAWRDANERGHVALPAYACYDLATAAAGAQVPVGFFDVAPGNLGPDLESLERSLTGGASVVVVAPLYGIPVDWDTIAGMCADHGAILIEDAAQGHGALWKGRAIGAHGELSVLSFGRGKGWTGGAGGALLARGRLADLGALSLPAGSSRGAEVRTLLRTAAQQLMGRPSVFGLVAAVPGLQLGETVYHAPTAPTSISGVAADLAVAHHELARSHGARRRSMADEWAVALREFPGIDTPDVPTGGTGGYLRYPILVARVPEDPALLRMAARCGIARGYPQPLPRLGVLRSTTGTSHSRRPGAERLSRALLTLPTHWQVTRADRARALDLLAEFFVKGTGR